MLPANSATRAWAFTLLRVVVSCAAIGVVSFGLVIRSSEASRSAVLGLTIPSSVDISITADGFDPPSVTILAGDNVNWTNLSGQPQSITSESGLFDSGELPDGAGFSMALAIPGFHTYQSTTNSTTS